jgi:thiol-disulfide isomerase/thioredoxin
MKTVILRALALLALLLAPSALLRASPVKPVPAPAWKLKDVDGKLVSWEQFKGKVVVVDFWATWCPPCRTEIPGYIALQKKYAADGLVIVGISVDTDGPEVVRKYMKDVGINYQIVIADDQVQDLFAPIQGYPTTFIIDRDGLIRDKKLGREPTAEYEKAILAVLKPPAA